MRYRMKRLLAELLSAVILLSLLPAMAWAAGVFEGADSGDGSAGNPYLISTAEQLKKLSEYVNGGKDCKGLFFKLMGDIDLGGEEWTPIGSYDNSFAGSFDGNSKDIRGLTIDNRSQWQGLFGVVREGGKIANLGVEGSVKTSAGQSGGIVAFNEGTIENCHFAGNVTGSGSQQYGGIAGHNSGTISKCYNTGTISGSGQHFGGIAGGNRGIIQDCYNIGAVDGQYAGGIVGSCTAPYGGPNSTIQNCYNTGSVSGGSSGGITGMAYEATIEKCYFLENTADESVGSDYSSNKTDVDSKSEEEFRSLADTLGEDWTNDTLLGRPVLKDNREPIVATADHPFEIPDKETLEKVRNYINSSSDGGEGKTFKLTANIDLKGEEWTPIGGGDNPFQGTFDGGGFTVSGLYIGGYDRYRGLFGYIGENGAVYDLTVEGEVSGLNDIGGIAGKCDGRIEKCVNAATVTGIMDAVGGIVGEAGGSASVQECVNRGRVTGNNSYIGGIVGKISGDVTIDGCENAREISGQIYVGGIAGGADSVPSAAVIKNCDNAGEVRGDGLYTGGVIGLNDANCTVTDCRSFGSVSGSNNVGGIVGRNSGTVKNCYNTGEIAGRAFIGGVVGENDNGTVENCYNIASVTGENGMVGGVVGENVNGTVENCYNIASVTGESGMVGGVAGAAYGAVTNCYNTGAVTGTSSTGGVAGVAYGAVTNCYYLDTCCADGEAGTKKTADEFASGEVAYLLQNGQDPQVWGQAVGGGTPELTASEDKKVFKITGEVEDQADVVWYSNRAATLPTTEPTKAGFAFAGWSTEEEGTEANFEKGATVSDDMTVYAVWKVPFEGSGTAEDPYRISDKEELKAFRDYVNSGKGSGEYFKLTGNVDLNDEPWTPIGNSGSPFQGTFDGDGHTISGLNINTHAEGGLFGHISGATVKNLTVTGSVTGNEDVGGVAGYCDANSTIENCANGCTVTANGCAGGIVGTCRESKITGCRNTGDVSDLLSGSGGIVGRLDGGSVTDCFSTGNIKSTANGYTGGIVGTSGSPGTVTNCYNSGTVYNEDSMKAGGIAGNPSVDVSNSYYLDACGAGGKGTAKTADEFASGEVAYLLQAGQSAQVWGQTVGGGYPELTGDAEKKVCQVIFRADLTPKYEKTLYANLGGTLPEAETLKPEKEGYTFVKWALTDSPEGEAFTASTPVKGDLILYAIFEKAAEPAPTEPEPSSSPGTSSEPTESEPSKSPETSEGPQNPTGGPSGGSSGNNPGSKPSGTPNDTPKTGDEGQLSLWLALMLLSLAGAGATAWMPIMGRKRPAGMRKANERK